MKYVMLETRGGLKLPIIFPDFLVHAHVAGAMQQVMLAMSSTDKQFHENRLQAMLDDANFRGVGAKLMSAGFVGFTGVTVSGESESLGGVKSRPSDAGRILMGDSVMLMPDDVVHVLHSKIKNQS